MNPTMQLRQSAARRLLPGKPLEQQREGRTCDRDDCDTRLSRYNPSTVCAEHAGWSDVPARRRQR